jgi:hypothetical protein
LISKYFKNEFQERRKVAKGGNEELPSATIQLPEPTIQEEFRRLKVVKSGGKVRHI